MFVTSKLIKNNAILEKTRHDVEKSGKFCEKVGKLLTHYRSVDE